jgi:hypothetical protein
MSTGIGVKIPARQKIVSVRTHRTACRSKASPAVSCKIASRLRDARAERGRVSDIFPYARVRILPEVFYLIGNHNFL